MSTGASRDPPWLPGFIVAAALVIAPHLATADTPPAVTAWGLPQLMASMHGVRTASARFVETKFVQLLGSTAAILRHADLQRAGQAAKADAGAGAVPTDRQWRPPHSRQPDGKTRDLSLSEVPEIGALVESIRATLAGDGATLTRYYAPTLSGTAGDWSLMLEPRDSRLRDLVTTIRIQGEGTVIRSIETVERDGDRTEMTITPDPR